MKYTAPSLLYILFHSTDFPENPYLHSDTMAYKGLGMVPIGL